MKRGAIIAEVYAALMAIARLRADLPGASAEMRAVESLRLHQRCDYLESEAVRLLDHFEKSRDVVSH